MREPSQGLAGSHNRFRASCIVSLQHLNLSTMSSKSPGDQKTPSRPGLLHNAATVIPAIQDPDQGIHSARADTSHERSRSSAGILDRRRADNSHNSQLPHLDIKLPDYVNLDEPHEPPSLSSSLPATPIHISTAPIAIPRRTGTLERPPTPVSGRPRDVRYRESSAFQKLKAKHSPSSSETSSETSNSPTHSRLSKPFAMGGRRSPQTSYHPSSPLSPSGSPFTPRSEAHRKARPSQESLNLAGLPKFHPANFTHADSSNPALPRSSRGLTLHQRGNRHGSEAQGKLHQYQRDVVANFTRAHSALSQTIMSKPESPRLVPHGSPGDPMTPFTLEAQSDYLMAGSRRSSPSAASGREIVERLVQQENERRQHPEASPGSLSPAISPSVSPAVSPAGGPE